MQNSLRNKPRRSVAYKLINHRVGRVMNKITFQMYIYELECLKVITLSFEIYISNNYHIIMISRTKLETVNSFCYKMNCRGLRNRKFDVSSSLASVNRIVKPVQRNLTDLGESFRMLSCRKSFVSAGNNKKKKMGQYPAQRRRPM